MNIIDIYKENNTMITAVNNGNKEIIVGGKVIAPFQIFSIKRQDYNMIRSMLGNDVNIDELHIVCNY